MPHFCTRRWIRTKLLFMFHANPSVYFYMYHTNRKIHIQTMGTYNTHSVNAQFTLTIHDDVVKWKHFPHYWPFVRGIHRSPVKSPHKGQWRGTLMLSLSCAWINDWMNNREAGDLTRHHANYDVNVMFEHGFGCVSLWFDSCRLYPYHSGCLRWHR